MYLHNTMKFASLVGVMFYTSVSAQAASLDHTHAEWTALLNSHVKVINQGEASQVDYAGFKIDEAKLQAYLDSLSAVTVDDYEGFEHDQKKAFLMNAYNAFTIQLILTEYPSLSSIKDLGGLFSNPWKEEFVPLLGETISLDDIEHGKLRAPGAFDDYRVHFAVNCASIGCPPLREEAFVADRLNAQLEEQTTRFLSDHTRNYYDEEKQTLYVSKIFDWYGEDFEKGFLGIDSLTGFFAKHAEQLTDAPASQKVIQSKDVKVKFLDYDWGLNDTQK